jgi:hypothetical protein
MVMSPAQFNYAFDGVGVALLEVRSFWYVALVVLEAQVVYHVAQIDTF